MTAPKRPYPRVGKTCDPVSLTKQSFKDECDINRIMARYEKTGMIDHYNEHSSRYGEHSAPDFLEAQIIIADSKSMFEQLPAKVRATFHNSPAEFLEFTDDPTREYDDYVSLGLALPRQAPMSAPEGSAEPDPTPTPDASNEASDGD